MERDRGARIRPSGTGAHESRPQMTRGACQGRTWDVTREPQDGVSRRLGQASVRRVPRPLRSAVVPCPRWLAVGAMAAVGLLLQACAIVPGYDAYSLRTTGQSSVEVPVMTPEGLVPARIQVQQIDAALVIDLEQQAQSALSSMPPQQVIPAVAGDYRLGVGDVINIVVWGHPELTIPTGEFRTAEEAGTVVSEDGTIFFPYAGVVTVAGRTLSEVRETLTQSLSRFIEGVQLEVRVAAFRSKRVYVVGEVNRPGIYAITDIAMTMVEAINQAGGFTDNADRANVILNRDGQTVSYNLLALYEEGDISQNIRLQHGDIVSVADNALNKVYLMGELRGSGRQGAGSMIIRRNRTTLAEALSDAGNINMATANPYQIFVVRGGPIPRIYHLAAKEPDALLLAERFRLEPRDIVYVDTADLVRWNKFISNVLPTRNFFNIDTSLQDGSNVSGF